MIPEHIPIRFCLMKSRKDQVPALAITGSLPLVPLTFLTGQCRKAPLDPCSKPPLVHLIHEREYAAGYLKVVKGFMDPYHFPGMRMFELVTIIAKSFEVR